MTKIVVYHRHYGCDTGCCGHAVSMDDDEGKFLFEHPYGQDPQAFARELVIEALGKEHVADLDWEQCLIIDEC